MPGTATPIFPQTVRTPAVQLVNASGTTLQTLFAGGANGSQVSAITVASTDGTARDIRLWMTISSVDYLLCTVSIPANSGNTNALPPIDVFRSTMVPGLSFDAMGNRVLYVASGATLRVSAGAAVSSSTAISVVVTSAGDY